MCESLPPPGGDVREPLDDASRAVRTSLVWAWMFALEADRPDRRAFDLWEMAMLGRGWALQALCSEAIDADFTAARATVGPVTAGRQSGRNAHRLAMGMGEAMVAPVPMMILTPDIDLGSTTEADWPALRARLLQYRGDWPTWPEMQYAISAMELENLGAAKYRLDRARQLEWAPPAGGVELSSSSLVAMNRRWANLPPCPQDEADHPLTVGGLATAASGRPPLELPAHAPRLCVGEDHVYLDGQPVPLNMGTEGRKTAQCLVRHLLAAEGNWRSSTELDDDERAAGLSGGCGLHIIGKLWTRIRKNLPPDLSELIETDRRKGSRLSPAVWHRRCLNSA